MSKKSKVLFVGPLPPPYSGPELSMQQFLESELLNDTFEINFLQTNFRTTNVNKGKIGLGMIFSFFIYFRKLTWKLISYKPAVVYYPVTPTQIGWIGRDVWTILLSKLFGAKVIIHLRGSHFKLNFQEFRPIFKKLITYTLTKVDKGIVQAQYLKDQFMPGLHENDVEVLYQAMDIEEFPMGKTQNIEKGKILVIGHLTKAKGYTDILKVIPKVAKKYPYVRFCFAGNMRKGERGVFYNQFTGEKIEYEDPFIAEDEIKSSRFSKNYQNLGIIEGKEKLQHLHTAEVFLSFSYSEGFSRALLEAMSTGKPLVYTPVGAHKEVLNERNGMVVKPGDLDELQLALEKILENSKNGEIGDYNSKQVATEFSLGKIIIDFQNILLNTLNT